MPFQEEAFLFQKCTANCGCVGSWIAPQGTKDNLSPVFKDTADLFNWLNANGWEATTPYSFRYIKKEGTPNNDHRTFTV
jgi:hypothetical protein